MDRQDTGRRHGDVCTERLRLRPWRDADAVLHRRLWEERDDRVPARRRIGADGEPSIATLRDWARASTPMPAPGLLVVELRATGVAIGYCGLVENSVGQPDEPELAFEFLQASWGQGFATEAARAVVQQSAAIGYDQLAATVRAWNTGSLAVLAKLGFTDTGEREHDAEHGDSLLLRLPLR